MSESLRQPGSPARLRPYQLFEVFGVEIEYMIVDRDSLEIRPFSDKLLSTAGGRVHNDIDMGEINWSNELAMHLIEFNFSNPEKTLFDKDKIFQNNISQANSILKNFNAMLLPGGMHPFLNPRSRDVKLWPFELTEVYNSFDKIFDCHNHGWINVQSAHLNLPFSGDDEFQRLHGAIRFILPLIPALAASSPIVEGKITGYMDSRLFHYRNNQTMIPEIAGDVIPEIIGSQGEYKTEILDKMYKAIAPHDPEGIMQDEWLNSRGAIARFDRSSIEIRLIDSQECAASDLAVLQIISLLVKWLVEMGEKSSEVFNGYYHFSQTQMVDILNNCIRHGDQAVIGNLEYLKILNPEAAAKAPVSAREIWCVLFDMLLNENDNNIVMKTCTPFIDEYKAHGTLANRIIKAAGDHPGEEMIKKIYHELSLCLAENKVYTLR